MADTDIHALLAEHAVANACQLCLFQREGDRADILRRLLWPETTRSVEFGHCFACIHCPGERGPSSCLGFSPVDLDAPEYPAQPGRMYPDTDQAWSRVDCVPVLPQQAEHLWSYAQSYADENLYQVVNRQGGRSCLGFCEDVAFLAGLTPHARAGNWTIPGGMRFSGAVFSLDSPKPIDALGLTHRLVLPPHASPAEEDTP